MKDFNPKLALKPHRFTILSPKYLDYRCASLNLVVYFVNANLPEEGFQVLLSKKDLSKLLGDIPNISKKSNIDHYMELPSGTFCNGKYSVLSHFCFAEFLEFNVLENKSNKIC